MREFRKGNLLLKTENTLLNTLWMMDRGHLQDISQEMLEMIQMAALLLTSEQYAFLRIGVQHQQYLVRGG